MRKICVIGVILAVQACAHSVRDYGASGSNQQTAASAVTVSGSTSVSIPSPLDFVNGQGVFVQNNGTGKSVGPNGSPFCATILSGGGSTSLLLSNAPAVSTSFGVVMHDDGSAQQSALDAVGTSGGTLNWPAGTYNNNCAPLHNHSAIIRLVGDGRPSTILQQSNGNFDYGVGFVSTDPPAVYVPAGTFSGAALLGGPGNAYSTTAGALRGYLSLRQCKLYCGELNGLPAFTAETTFRMTTITTRVGLLVSSGMRDSVDGQKSAFALGVESTGALRCMLRTSAGAVTVTGPAGSIVPGATHHGALSYDGTTLRCFLDGVLAASAPQSGLVVQGDFEDVRTNGDVRYFPDGGHLTYSNPDAFLDGIRLSNSARYTASFAPPAAKWANVDSNTWLQCNFDNQPDIFTVCQSTNGGTALKNVYLPLLGSSCGGGSDTTWLEGMSLNHASGWLINHNPGTQLTNLSFQSSHNGLMFGGCSYWTRMYDVIFSGAFGGRYGVIQTQGILQVDGIEFSQMADSVGGIFGGNSDFHNIFVQAAGNTPQISMLFRSGGSSTIGGIKPAVILSWGTMDIEEAHPNMVTPMMFDQMNGIIQAMDLECASANPGCFPLIVNGPVTVKVESGGMAGGFSASAQIHTVGLPTVIIEGVQNPQGKPWCDVPANCKVPVLQQAP